MGQVKQAVIPIRARKRAPADSIPPVRSRVCLSLSFLNPRPSFAAGVVRQRSRVNPPLCQPCLFSRHRKPFNLLRGMSSPPCSNLPGLGLFLDPQLRRAQALVAFRKNFATA